MERTGRGYYGVHGTALSPMARWHCGDRPDCLSGILSSGASADVHGQASTSPSPLATAFGNALTPGCLENGEDAGVASLVVLGTAQWAWAADTRRHALISYSTDHKTSKVLWRPRDV